MKDKILTSLPAEYPFRDTLYWFNTIDSTNNYLKKLAQTGAPQGTAVVAGQQTAGRGRLGRSFFSPAEKNTKFTYNLSNTTSIYTQFLKDYETFDQELISAKQDIDNYLADTGDVYNTFAEDFHSLKTYFYNDGYITVINLAGNLSTEDFNKCKTVFSTLRAKIKNLTDYMIYNIKNKKINFFFSLSSYEKIYKSLSSMYDNLPSDKDLESFTSSMIIERYNLLLETYDIKAYDIEISNVNETKFIFPLPRELIIH